MAVNKIHDTIAYRPKVYIKWLGDNINAD